MLHLPADKNMVHNKQSVPSVSKHMPEYKIDNRIVYDIIDPIYKDTNLYLYVKQHKSKREGREGFHAIESKWLGPNHVNANESEAEMTLQALT